MQDIVDNYFSRFGDQSLDYGPIALNPNCKVVIVVPAHYEEPEFLLSSLEKCAVANAESMAILWLINQSGAELDQSFHLQQEAELSERCLQNDVPLFVRSALNLSPKHAGVGMARKIGMDLALEALGAINQDGLIVCLDGDCKVSANYLEELLQAAQRDIKGAACFFEHPLEGLDEQRKKAIIDYEIWLRYYIQALKYTAYPWSYHTVGSSMLARASVYAKIGGMNRRKAGEDFYFLHKLMPQGDFVNLNSLCVYPSARISQRVPFGTGRAMQEVEQGRKNFQSLYHPKIFAELKQIHSGAEKGIGGLFEDPLWNQFLQDHPKYAHSFEALLSRSKGQNALGNFWMWWDGFKVLRFVHYRQNTYPDVGQSEALNTLLGIDTKEEEALIQLRDLDRNHS